MIDGMPEDWIGRSPFSEDPVGDMVQGYLDLTKVYAFINQDAMYILLETADPTASFVLFDMMFRADDHTYQITYQPGQNRLSLVDYTSGSSQFIKYLENSTADFKTDFEMRIDLDDLNRPKSLVIIGIGAMADTNQGWGPVDRWEGGTPPVVNEVDLPRVASEENRYFYARYWNLPEPFVGDVLFTSPLENNAFLARSQNGTVYTSLGDGAGPGVSLIDIDLGTATPILKLPYGIGISNPVGGPGDTLILGVGGEIWQINPDGSHEIWGRSPNAFPI
jgi:hypothetical protein